MLAGKAHAGPGMSSQRACRFTEGQRGDLCWPTNSTEMQESRIAYTIEEKMR